MNPKQRIIAALELRAPDDIVPTFESAFDGNMRPRMEVWACGPHAPHSIDPTAGMDIAEVKKRKEGQ